MIFTPTAVLSIVFINKALFGVIFVLFFTAQSCACAVCGGFVASRRIGIVIVMHASECILRMAYRGIFADELIGAAKSYQALKLLACADQSYGRPMRTINKINKHFYQGGTCMLCFAHIKQQGIDACIRQKINALRYFFSSRIVDSLVRTHEQYAV